MNTTNYTFIEMNSPFQYLLLITRENGHLPPQRDIHNKQQAKNINFINMEMENTQYTTCKDAKYRKK